MIPVSGILNRLRGIIDPYEYAKDTLTQDGSEYFHVLTSKPVQSGSEQIYFTDATLTTGVPRLIYRNGTQTSGYASTNNYVYTMDYVRGEFTTYYGSGYVINSGLNLYAPPAESNLIVYYYKSKYTDAALIQYIGDAVAHIELALNLGMYVSGIYGRPSDHRDSGDVIDYNLDSDCSPPEIFVFCEDSEILQALIAEEAALNLMTRERRLGAGNAIKIVDGDITIDTSVNQRYLRDFVNDFAKEHANKIRWAAINLLEGYSIRQLDEIASQSIQGGQWNSPWNTNPNGGIGW